jgi:predicted ABC-type transport system involved in lysophospholipase L1 biosynthesis ATPase subunit
MNTTSVTSTTGTLSARNLVKRYGPVVALGGVTLDLQPGESVAIMGPSGSGKSTLLHCLSGILPPDEGEVTLGHLPVSQLSDAERSRLRRDRFGFVFQDGQLIGELPARENVALAAAARRGGARRGATSRRRMAGPARAGVDGRATSRRAVRRPGPARRDRPSPGARSGGDLRRRADRRPGPGHRPRGHAGAHDDGALGAPRWSSSPTTCTWPAGADGSSRSATPWSTPTPARRPESWPTRSLCPPNSPPPGCATRRAPAPWTPSPWSPTEWPPGWPSSSPPAPGCSSAAWTVPSAWLAAQQSGDPGSPSFAELFGSTYVVLALVACALLIVPILTLGGAAARLGRPGPGPAAGVPAPDRDDER